MCYGALCSSTPSDNPPPPMSHSWDLWWPLRAQRWLHLPQGGTEATAFHGIALPPQDPLLPGRDKDSGSRSNAWPAEVDRSWTRHHVKAILALRYLALASPLALWVWVLRHSSLPRPQTLPRKAFPGCCHN